MIVGSGGGVCMLVPLLREFDRKWRNWETKNLTHLSNSYSILFQLRDNFCLVCSEVSLD